MKVLSLDLSTHSTGWAVVENTKLIDYGLITASSKDNVSRIKKIVKDLKPIINKYENTIDKVVVEEVRPEDLSHSAYNLHTQKVLMWLQAGLIFLLHDINPAIKVEFLYPSEWRASCGIKNGRGIKREELKKKDIQFVKDMYDIDVNDDIADAIGIGYGYNQKNTEMIIWGQ